MKRVACISAVALLGACAEAPVKRPGEEMVVVLPGPDGKAGSVVVERAGERTVLDRPYSGARISGAGRTESLAQSGEAVQREFAGVLAALPARPATFLLYFVTGRDELADESKARMSEILVELRKRPVPDVAVIGHTDTVGAADANDRLSLQRAERVKGFLTGIGIPAERIATSGRGERELLVPTADNTAEARNRRVEINVR